RGGELPAVTVYANKQTLIPLTTTGYDAFGDAVTTTKYARTATLANSYGTPAPDPGDQSSYDFYDSLGHDIRSVDAEGASKQSSYDALGRVAKTWAPITSNDGTVNNAIQVFQYDRLGHQTATIVPSFQPSQRVPLSPSSFARTQASYNAFGEIVSKGLNDG